MKTLLPSQAASHFFSIPVCAEKAGMDTGLKESALSVCTDNARPLAVPVFWGLAVTVCGGNSTGDGTGVVGVNQTTGSSGFLGGKERHFNGHVGVYGESPQNGVFGYTASKVPEDNAVYGQNDGAGRGVTGVNRTTGCSGFLAGIDPVFKHQVGVYGFGHNEGVIGIADGGIGGTRGVGTGVYGTGRFGVRGERPLAPGGKYPPLGFLAGIDYVSGQMAGVYGQSDLQGVVGYAGNKGTGIVGYGGKYAGAFYGNVLVTGDITAHDVILSGGDCAEDFDIAGLEAVEAGTVTVIDKEGTLQPCQDAYDKKVTGVISGAGEYKPGVILGRQQSTSQRLPLALVGRVYCKVDAQFGAIEIGDLLTTSPTKGHAMKAAVPLKAFGAVIGKALRPLTAGRGLVPILVALQ